MKNFRSQNTNTKSNLFMILNFLLSIATGGILIAFTDILKNQFLFLTFIVVIFSWMLLGTFLIKKLFIEFYEYWFDENIIIRKNLKTGDKTSYTMDQIKKYFIPTPYETSHLLYIELVFSDNVVWKIFVPPFSLRQTKIYEEFEKQIKEISTDKNSNL